MLEYQFTLTETVDIPAVIGGGAGCLQAININKSPTGISARPGLVHQNSLFPAGSLDINCPARPESTCLSSD